jgi:hypothetical protein
MQDRALRSSSIRKARKYPYDIYCGGAINNPIKNKELKTMIYEGVTNGYIS